MQSISEIATRFGALRQQLDRVILGQDRVKTLAITSLLAGGHMLLEGVPGTGKTLLSLALSRLLGCRFRRERDDLSHFEALAPLLTGDSPDLYEKVANDLGMSRGALRVALHRMRGRFRA